MSSSQTPRKLALFFLLSAFLLSSSAAPAAPAPKWYEHAWRRAVIDMHIPDWDEKFLSELDPDLFVGALVQSRAQSIVLYAQSHVGLFNYPTKVGAQHRGLKGKNVLQELIAKCHEKHIAVVLYTSLIHDRWAFDNHPGWRMKLPDGKSYGEGSRYGVVCPNSPYREYVRAWVTEMCQTFDFEGMRFDMTFWVGVCYCDHCKARFAAEVGGEMPVTVDWLDPRWVALQRKREEWLADFASIATGTVRKLKPGASVEHQSSTYPLHWGFGVGMPLVAQNDFLQGDFYGDSLQGSFVRKLLDHLTPNRPFGFETSFSVELRDHTGSKPEALLEAKASAAIADGAAFIFIDAIDPIGTVNPRVHERMGRIFDRLQPYYEHLGGERVADAAIYYSLESKFSFKQNGKSSTAADRFDAHTESSMSAAKALIAAHVPFTVITRKAIRRLSDYKVLILSGVQHMDREEADAIRQFVRSGGLLYASGSTSAVTSDGALQKDFLLADVFGASLVKADWQDREHYVAPTAAGAAHFLEFSARYPAFCRGPGMEVSARQGAKVLATTTLPWPAPEPTKFSSIHSNPPWVPTDGPEIILNELGKGRSIYCATMIENVEALRATFTSLVRSLGAPFHVELEAPAAVEATLFRQPDRKRLLLSLINFQKDLPNIPVDGIRARVRPPTGMSIGRVVQVPGGVTIPHSIENGAVVFTAPRLETLAVFALEEGHGS